MQLTLLAVLALAVGSSGLGNVDLAHGVSTDVGKLRRKKVARGCVGRHHSDMNELERVTS